MSADAARKECVRHINAAMPLLFFFLYLHGVEVFILENLMAVETFQIVDAIAPGDDLCAGVLASGLHKHR
jgi:hypothetical protein